MKTLIAGGLLAGAMLLSGAVMADEMNLSACSFPEAPAVPDGSTASMEEVLAARDAVKAFQAELNAGRDCLTGEKAKVDEASLTEEQKAEFNRLWDASVDAEEQAAAAINASIKAYNAANP